MNRRILVAVVVLIVVAAAGAAYMVFRTPLAASQPITAIPLDPTQSTAPNATQSAYPVAGTPAPNSNLLLFTIDPSQSTASFTINEVLGGSPNTVVGTTNQVAGQIQVDLTNPAASQVGTIQVDARTLVTDSNMRNRAINNAILQTNSYEYVTFKPTSISGFPTTVQVGNPYSFKISGDLTIRNVTKSVTFDVQVTAASQNELKGSASATVLRSDYGIQIPNVPNVADVTDEVKLQIDFVATR